MPFPCFSYPADVPPGIRNPDAGQPGLRAPRLMPFACFSYPADVPRSMPLPCFSYPTTICFRYPPDVPPGIGNRDAAQPGLRDPRRMPYTCFRY